MHTHSVSVFLYLALRRFTPQNKALSGPYLLLCSFVFLKPLKFKLSPLSLVLCHPQPKYFIMNTHLHIQTDRLFSVFLKPLLSCGGKKICGWQFCGGIVDSRGFQAGIGDRKVTTYWDCGEQKTEKCCS